MDYLALCLGMLFVSLIATGAWGEIQDRKDFLILWALLSGAACSFFYVLT